MKVAIKWGIISAHGEEILSVEYCNVWNFYGKNRYTVRLEKDRVSSDFTLRHKPSFFSKHCNNACRDNYGTHYGEFSGSYAQDVMGYSDDIINDAFEGDPDAYWNID